MSRDSLTRDWHANVDDLLVLPLLLVSLLLLLLLLLLIAKMMWGEEAELKLATQGRINNTNTNNR